MPSPVETDIVIYGGGAGGTCAAIQACRMGARVHVVEPSRWLGGMITAAGVSALDGNERGLGGGLVHDLRAALAEHYGSEETLRSGWVSNTCFEPRVAHRILQDWVEPLDALTVHYEAEVTSYERSGGARREVTVQPAAGDAFRLRCRVFVDATEYGDGLALAGLPCRLGRESREELGESAAPEQPDDHMQDLTLVATLVHRPDARPDPDLPAEPAYWKQFRCSTSVDCHRPDPDWLGHPLHDAESFIGYGRLPDDRFMLNWPFRSNDYGVTPRFFEDRDHRRKVLERARHHTLQYVAYMQQHLGLAHWQLDRDQYPSRDGLALIPYIRESRRLANGREMVQDDVVPRPGAVRAPQIRDSIAVGDYFLDHHHAASHAPPGERLVEEYSDNAPFQVPVSVFLTDDDPLFLAAEKNIAVSHIVNGCTRLQPAVMLMGQAAGALAALACSREAAPADVSVLDVQDALLEAGCQLYPVYDVPRDHPLFRPVQEFALAGVLDDEDPLDLQPDAPLDEATASRWARRAGAADLVQADEDAAAVHPDDLQPALRPSRTGPLTRGRFLERLHALTHGPSSK